MNAIIHNFITGFRTVNFNDVKGQLLANPSTFLAIFGVLILVFGFIKIRKVKLSTKMIAQIGIALALSSVLQIFRLYHFPEGGSVTLGSLVPIIIIAIVYGPEVGFLAGFLHGMITLILDPYILQPVQFLFDYPLPSMALGLAGYFGNKKVLGAVVAIFVKYIFHFLSGVIFFGSYAPKGMSPIIYSLTVNGSMMLIEGGIAVVIIALLPMDLIIKNIKQPIKSEALQ